MWEEHRLSTSIIKPSILKSIHQTSSSAPVLNSKIAKKGGNEMENLKSSCHFHFIFRDFSRKITICIWHAMTPHTNSKQYIRLMTQKCTVLSKVVYKKANLNPFLLQITHKRVNELQIKMKILDYLISKCLWCMLPSTWNSK